MFGGGAHESLIVLWLLLEVFGVGSVGVSWGSRCASKAVWEVRV